MPTSEECLRLFNKFAKSYYDEYSNKYTTFITATDFKEIIDELGITQTCETCDDYVDGICTDYKSHYCANGNRMENRWSPKLK